MSQQNPSAPQPYQPQPQPKKRHTLRTVLIALCAGFAGMLLLIGIIGIVTGVSTPAKSAVKYLEMTHFSRSGLIEQLESSAGEGFTHAQAVYGVTKAGL